VNPKGADPGHASRSRDEFFKRYDRQDEAVRRRAMRRRPFSATWALFTEVFPKAKSYEPAELARDRAQARPARGPASPTAAASRFTNNDWPTDPKDCRPESGAPRSACGKWQRRPANKPDIPGQAGDHRAGSWLPLPNWSQRADVIAWCEGPRSAARPSDRRSPGLRRGHDNCRAARPLRPAHRRHLCADEHRPLTLIFGVLRIVNFAHGEFLMIANVRRLGR